VLKDVETIRTNANSRWGKNDHSRTLSRFHTNDEYSSKIATLPQSKVEILRANSPTLKRLLAARIKLEKYSNSIARLISPSRQSARETPYPKSYEKQSSAVSQPVHVTPPLPPPPAAAPPPPSPPPSGKQIKPKSSLDDKPLDKITYEKTWSINGNMKQKCSLEIWLPKPRLDDDDDRNTNRTITPEVNLIEKKPQTITKITSRRSSVVKITATTTVTNIDTKPPDEVSSKKYEPIIIPRVYPYGDYIMNLPEERPRSSKSVTTVKSDSVGSIRNIRRHRTRSHIRRLSTSTHRSEEILRFGTIEVPTSAKNLSVHTKSTSPSRDTKSATKLPNPAMINELMQKYSLIKKNHQELTQTKLKLEKSIIDSKPNPNLIKDQSPRSRPPLIPESTSLVAADDHPTVTVRKLLTDTSPIRSITEINNTNSKLLDRRSTPHKLSQPAIHPHLRIFSLANQRQHRRSSATVPAALIPTISGKKTDEISRVLQRSKTLDVVLDIPKPINGKSLADNSLQHKTNGTNEQQILSRVSKRSALASHSEKQTSASIIKNSGQNLSRSTTIPTNTILIHFNHGNNERNYLVPE